VSASTEPGGCSNTRASLCSTFIGSWRPGFTHAAGTCKRTAFPGGFLAMWMSLEKKNKFPCKYLVESKQTLAEFVSNHDNKRPNLQDAA
jgi:hypothetical protein